MGTKTIGNLAVLISANADKFESVMNGIEKRTVSFTSRVTAMPNKLMQGFGHLGSGFVSSADQVMKTAENLMSFLPGGRLAAVGMGLSGGLSGWGESAQRGLETMQMLNRESERFGVSPKFFRALEMAAGADAQVVGPALDKMLGAMARLRSGDKATTDAMAPFVDNLEQVKRMNPEQFLMKIAGAYKNIGDQVTKAAFAGTIFGDRMADDVHFLLNPEKINKSAKALKDMGLYQENLGDVMKAGNEIAKHIALAQEAVDARRGFKKSAADILALRYEQGQMSWSQWAGSRAQVFADTFLADSGYAGEIVAAYAAEMKKAQGPRQPMTPEQYAENKRIQTLKEGREALAKYNESLDKQLVMFGMTAHEAAMYEMQLKGVTQRELEAADNRFQRIEGKRLAESLKTPAEKWADLQAKGMPGQQFLNAEQRNKLWDMAFNQNFGMDARISQARSLLESARGRPVGVERGSSAAAEFFADLQNQSMTGGWQNDIGVIKDAIIELDKKQLEQNRIDADMLRTLRNDNEVRKVLAIPN